MYICIPHTPNSSQNGLNIRHFCKSKPSILGISSVETRSVYNNQSRWIFLQLFTSLYVSPLTSLRTTCTRITVRFNERFFSFSVSAPFSSLPWLVYSAHLLSWDIAFPDMKMLSLRWKADNKEKKWRGETHMRISSHKQHTHTNKNAYWLPIYGILSCRWIFADFYCFNLYKVALFTVIYAFSLYVVSYRTRKQKQETAQFFYCFYDG